MSDQFVQCYKPHNRCSVHKDGIVSRSLHFRFILDQLNDGDTVVVYRLDRLARETHDLTTLISMMQAKGINIALISQPTESGEHNVE